MAVEDSTSFCEKLYKPPPHPKRSIPTPYTRNSHSKMKTLNAKRSLTTLIVANIVERYFTLQKPKLNAQFSLDDVAAGGEFLMNVSEDWNTKTTTRKSHETWKTNTPKPFRLILPLLYQSFKA